MIKNNFIRWITEFFTILLIFSSVYTLLYINKNINNRLNNYKEITDSGILRAVAVKRDINNSYPGPSQDYFIDIADFLALRLWSKLDLVYAKTYEEAERLILQQKADILLRTNPANNYKKTRLSSTNPYIKTSWHLIVNRDNIKTNKISDINNGIITVTSDNPALPVLKKMEKSNNFKLISDSETTVKKIFSLIESGEITGTVADNLTARSMRYLHPKAVIAQSIKEKSQIGFSTHPDAHDLKFRINLFIDNISDEEFIDLLAGHYFHKLDVFEYLDLRKFHRRIENRLPEYIDIIKKYSKEYNLDWRLVTSQIYQESHFNKWAESHASAKGLMQLMPSTADSLGVTNIYSPEENIKAGIKYLKKLYDIFDKTDNRNRMKIALATYNMGQGHMYDARDIARDFSLNPDKWYNMIRVLPLLKKRKYYLPLKYGYARGDEPVTYVRKIGVFYEVMKAVFPDVEPETQNMLSLN
ncbi:MAG: transglycosylase SLT domain-containing protein [Thermodesulfobacteriota bacterium]